VTDWRTKPTDRFVLRWIKINLSARVTPLLARIPGARPEMVTIASALLAVGAGVLLALGWAWQASLAAAVSQVLDGVDGQLARKTGRASRGGAFLDSVLDRYGDTAMVVGTVVYCMRLDGAVPGAAVVVVGALALVGSGAISYTSARAAELGIDLGRPTLASKGTRMTVMMLSALGTLLWQLLPMVALAYLAVHPNLVVVSRLARAMRTAGAERARGADQG
jgi:CDP-diacylglycerol--glycerol-3-phosphate 3-phosphatidyltransferase